MQKAGLRADLGARAPALGSDHEEARPAARSTRGGDWSGDPAFRAPCHHRPSPAPTVQLENPKFPGILARLEESPCVPAAAPRLLPHPAVSEDHPPQDAGGGT